MADKNETFVLARRRKDNVVMVLGRKLIENAPHTWEEIGQPNAPKKVIAKAEEEVEEAPEITMDFNTSEFESYNGKALTNIVGYREALDDMGVEYKQTHGMPGLKKLFKANQD